MKIGYVAEPYEESHASGMGYAVVGLLDHLIALNTGDEFIVYSSTPVSRSLVKGAFENRIIPRSFPAKMRWFLGFNDQVDVLLFTAPFLPLIVPRRVKTIMVCKELVSQKILVRGKGALFAFLRDKVLMPISLQHASFVLTPSEATKNDILKFYNIDPERIRVTYEGFQDLTSAPANEGGGAYAPSMKPFFFFTGKFKYRKNVHGIVSAFIAFKKRTGADCRLVIGGSASGSYYKQVKKEIDESGYKKDILFVGYVGAQDLSLFYKNALALVFVSFNEGFGMPILEAMSVGTPVITSNISSMAEIAANAALLVNPHEVGEISGAMERLYKDQNLRRDLASRGYERVKDFSWPKVAAQVMEILHAI